MRESKSSAFLYPEDAASPAPHAPGRPRPHPSSTSLRTCVCREERRSPYLWCLRGSQATCVKCWGHALRHGGVS